MNDTLNNLLAQGLEVAENAAYKRGYEKAKEESFHHSPTMLNYIVAHFVYKYGDQEVRIDRRIHGDKYAQPPHIVIEDMGLMMNGVEYLYRVHKK